MINHNILNKVLPIKKRRYSRVHPYVELFKEGEVSMKELYREDLILESYIPNVITALRCSPLTRSETLVNFYMVGNENFCEIIAKKPKNTSHFFSVPKKMSERYPLTFKYFIDEKLEEEQCRGFITINRLNFSSDDCPFEYVLKKGLTKHIEIQPSLFDWGFDIWA